MISETEEGYYHQKPNVKRRKSENPLKGLDFMAINLAGHRKETFWHLC